MSDELLAGCGTPGELRERARELLDPVVFDHVDCGAGTDATVRANREALDRLKFAPRVMVDVSTVDVRTTVLGTDVPHPILLAPAGSQRMVHPEAEAATARAAAVDGTLMVVSTSSSLPVEEIGGAGSGPKWFQLYLAVDRGLSRTLLDRAAAAGYRAVCITVDTPVQGTRDRDRRNGLHSDHRLPTAAGTLGNFDPERRPGPSMLLDRSITWRDVEWVRSVWDGPVMVKGVTTGADAVHAVDAGCAAVVVSNHGGRQLDSLPGTAEVLPEVVDAVAGRAEVYVDGGIRRGEDVVKAIALGARAALVGRPYLWGLAVGGQDGVRWVIDRLHDELETALTLLGRPTVAEVDRSVLRGAPAGS